MTPPRTIDRAARAMWAIAHPDCQGWTYDKASPGTRVKYRAMAAAAIAVVEDERQERSAA